MNPETFETSKWLSTDGEDYREYLYPTGTLRIDHPQKVYVKRKPEGDSHRVVALENDQPVSYYVAPGWLAIRWVGIDGTEQFDW